MSEEQKEEQIELFNEIFGQSFTIDNWNNKHFKNPYTVNSENIGLFSGEQIVAFNVFMPQKYFIDGVQCMMIQSCESVVKSEYRGNRYLEYILKEAERLLKDKYTVIYGVPNENSKPTFERLGYQNKLNFDIMLMIGKKTALLKAVFSRIFNVNANKKEKIDLDKKLECMYDWDKRIKISSEFPSKQNWDFFQDSIHVDKSKEFYNWKISNKTSSNKTKKYIYVEENGVVKAYCIISFSVNRGIYRAEIVDCFAVEGEELYLKAIVSKLKRLCGIISIIAPRTERVSELLKFVGFFKYKKDVSTLMYKVIDTKAGDVEKILRENDNWNFFMIEADTILN